MTRGLCSGQGRWIATNRCVSHLRQSSLCKPSLWIKAADSTLNDSKLPTNAETDSLISDKYAISLGVNPTFQCHVHTLNPSWCIHVQTRRRHLSSIAETAVQTSVPERLGYFGPDAETMVTWCHMSCPCRTAFAKCKACKALLHQRPSTHMFQICEPLKTSTVPKNAVKFKPSWLLVGMLERAGVFAKPLVKLKVKNLVVKLNDRRP